MSTFVTVGPGLDSHEELHEVETSEGEFLYRLDARLLQEEDGGFSVYVANLPGVVSQGDTEQEAITNIQEAFRAVMESYQADGAPIPWQEPAPSTNEHEITKWLSAYA